MTGYTLNGVPLVTRAAWGARPPRAVTRLPVAQAKGAAIHYSAAAPQADHRRCAASVRAIQAMHMAPGGLGAKGGGADIAYSHLLCQHGYCFRGRGIGVRTGANGTTAGNDWGYAVCVLGHDRADRADITPELRRALTRVLQWYEQQIPGHAIFLPHSYFRRTACPGDELRAFLQAGGWGR